MIRAHARGRGAAPCRITTRLCKIQSPKDLVLPPVSDSALAPTSPDPSPPAPAGAGAVVLSHGPAKSPPGRRRTHGRDVVRLREIQRLVAEGMPEPDAVKRVLRDPKIGLKKYLDSPARLDLRGEVARALGALIERAAPGVLEQVRAETETSLAASARDFVETLQELSRGEGLKDRDDAACGRVRVDATVAGLAVLGLGPRAGNRGPLVQVNNLQATQAHVAAAKEAEGFEETLGALVEAVETLLVHAPAAVAQEVRARVEAATGIRLRAIRTAEAVVS